MPHLCPLCTSDVATSQETTDDGIRYVVCSDRSHGPEGFLWEPTPPPGRSRRGDGLGAELRIWEKLLELFEVGADFVPYGDVEDRVFDRFPTEAQTLLTRYGHKFRDADHPSSQYSMSAYLAARLRELHREGHLELRWDKATGPWAHNVIISQWRRP